MPITAGMASEKISELKSKLAVYATWSDLLHANYMPSDGGRPEALIHREDGGTVTEAHLRSVLEDIEGKCEELREELAEWEALVFEPKTAEVTPLHPQTAVVKKAVDKGKAHARRVQPAPK